LDSKFDIRGSVHSAHILLGLACLAIGVLFGGFFLGDGVSKVRRTGDVLTVTGSAKQAVMADYAVWRGQISLRAGSMEDGYSQLRRHTDRFRTWIRAQGIADSSIVILPVASWDIPEVGVSGRETGRIAAHSLTQRFEMRSPDIAGLTKLSNEASGLMAEGVPLNSQPLEYLYTKLAGLRIQLLEAATRDARERAGAIAKATGGKIGAVRSAKQGVFQVTQRNSTDVSDYGMYDTSSPDKDVTAVVTVSFEVK